MRDQFHRVGLLEQAFKSPKLHILWTTFEETQRDMVKARADAIAAYEERTGEKIDERDQKVFLVHWGRVQDS